MDVLYYWTDIHKDIAAKRIGWLKSTREKLGQLAQGRPDEIWIIKTPEGHKGQVALLARLRWSDEATLKLLGQDAKSSIFYRADHPESVWFEDAESPEHIATATAWIRKHFPKAIKGNFQGDSGVHELRGDPLRELVVFARTLKARPFLLPVSSEETHPG